MPNKNKFELQEEITKSKADLLQETRQNHRHLYLSENVLKLLRDLVECKDTVFNYHDCMNILWNLEFVREIAWYNIITKTIEVLNKPDIFSNDKILIRSFIKPDRRGISIYVIAKKYKVKIIEISFEKTTSLSKSRKFQAEKEFIFINIYKLVEPLNRRIKHYKYQLDEMLKGKTPNTRKPPKTFCSGKKSVNKKKASEKINKLTNNIQQLEQLNQTLEDITKKLCEELIKRLNINMQVLFNRASGKNWCNIKELNAVDFLTEKIF